MSFIFTPQPAVDESSDMLHLSASDLPVLQHLRAASSLTAGSASGLIIMIRNRSVHQSASRGVFVVNVVSPQLSAPGPLSSVPLPRDAGGAAFPVPHAYDEGRPGGAGVGPRQRGRAQIGDLAPCCSSSNSAWISLERLCADLFILGEALPTGDVRRFHAFIRSCSCGLPTCRDPESRMVPVLECVSDQLYFTLAGRAPSPRKPYNPLIWRDFPCSWLLGDGSTPALHLLGHGEVYSIQLPSAYARSILTVPWVELGDSVVWISCAKSRFSASVIFHTKPFYGGKLHRISAEKFAAQLAAFACRVSGEWSGQLEFENPATAGSGAPSSAAYESPDCGLEDRQRNCGRYRRDHGLQFPVKYFIRDEEGDWIFKQPLQSGQATTVA
uniref:Triplex capsid protein 1 n=1 Tax=Macrostomum lignano TaxID=282301 RepID=A0A1I8F458_9PLAT